MRLALPTIDLSARTRRTLKQLAIVLAVLAALSLVILGGMVAALRSESGTHWLLQTTQRLLPELHIDAPRGNLIDGLQMDALRWETPNFALAIEQLDLRLRWPDLLRWRVTVSPLHIQRLIINPRGPENDDPVVLPALISPVALYLPDVAINELVIRSGDTVTTLRGIQTGARWLGADLQLRDAQLSYQQLHLAAAGRLRFRGDYGLALDGYLLGSPLPAAATVKAGGDLRHFKLDALLAGQWPLAAQAELRLLDKHLPMQLAAQLRQPVPLDLGADALTIKQAEFKASGDLTRLVGKVNSHLTDQRYGDSQLSSDLIWDGATLTAQALLALTKGQIRSDCTLVTNSPAHWNCAGQIAALPLTPWLGGLTGEVSSPFTVGGNLSAPITLAVELPALTGNLDNLALTGAIKVDSPDLRRWNIATANLDAGTNHLSASGIASDDVHGNSQLAIRLDAPQLAQLYAGLAGSAKAQIDLSGPIQQPSLRGDWSLRKFKYADIELAQGSGQLNLAALGIQASDLRWDVAGLQIKGFALDSSGALTGTRERHQWQISVRESPPSGHSPPGEDSKVGGLNGDASKTEDAQITGNQLELRCQGLLATNFSTYQLECPTLRGKIAVTKKQIVPWSQQAPLKARWDFARNEGELAGFCLLAQSTSTPTSLCLKPSLKYRQQQIQPFTAEVTALPLRWWRRQLPEGLRLHNDAHANAELKFVSQKPLRLDARASVEATEWRWQNAGTDEAQEVALDAATATAHFDAQMAHLTAAIHAPDVGSANAELTITEPMGAKHLQGRLAIEALQLGAFAWAIRDVEKLGGQIDGAVSFSGSAEQPLLQGQFALANGLIDTGGLGDPVQNLTAAVHFNNQHAALNGQFELGAGKAQLDGNVDWLEGYEKWKADLHLRGTQLAIEPITNSKIVLAPDLKLTAVPGAAQLGGEITLESADIRLQQLPPETVNPSRDTIVSGREADSAGTAMTMDINLNLGDHTHFAGFGADVDLKGQLRVRQEPAQELNATGRVNIAKGRYRAYGQRLTVRRGQFIFIGNIDNPDLNLEAIRELPPGNQDIVGLRVTGSLRDPVAQLFSEQSLSESDIAYYLLTGRKRDASQAGGQFSAGGTLLSLGLSSGEDQAAKLAEKFGIRGLQLGTAAGNNGQTEAEVSGYVLRDLYVRYGRSLGQTADSVTLQYQLSPNLMIQTITGIEEALDLIYTFSIK